MGGRGWETLGGELGHPVKIDKQTEENLVCSGTVLENA